MNELLSHARTHQKRIIDLIGRLVECESPSLDKAALARMARLVTEEAAAIAKVRRVRGGHLLLDFALPGKRKSGRILALGHIDTVHPIGSLERMKFRQRDGRLWGPGILDMKSGIAFFLSAVRALRDLDLPVNRRVAMLLVIDEEIGSPTSRVITEREARKSDAVLVLEPGSGLDGKLKTARKGVGHYEVTVHGRAAHSGLDFAAGANAIVELSRQIERIAAFTDLERGITVNPGVVSGGTAVNVVADTARMEADLRIARLRDAARIDKKFRSLKPVDKRCRIELAGGLNRPPLERTAGVATLFRTARALAAEIGVELEETATGGASDGNFTGALGIPTLDGLGGVGEGAHTSNESILIDRIADRTALLAGLLATL
jgi:glutamate carboxypeptidase